MQTYLRVVLAGFLMGSLSSASSVMAREKSVAEEILDILKANNQISEEQYQTLLKKARAEGETVPEAVKVSTPEPTDFRVYWNNGLRFDTTDKNFRLRIGGRIQRDWGVFDTDREIRDDVNNGFSIGDGTRFRRVRLNIQGDIYRTISFRTQYEFAGGTVALRDVYLQLKELPYVGNLMVGHFKEPYGLEELTSTNNMTFMERRWGRSDNSRSCCGVRTAFCPRRIYPRFHQCRCSGRSRVPGILRLWQLFA